MGIHISTQPNTPRELATDATSRKAPSQVRSRTGANARLPRSMPNTLAPVIKTVEFINCMCESLYMMINIIWMHQILNVVNIKINGGLRSRKARAMLGAFAPVFFGQHCHSRCVTSAKHQPWWLWSQKPRFGE